MHVIVLSCTHLQKNVSFHVLLQLVLTFDPTGKGSTSVQLFAGFLAVFGELQVTAKTVSLFLW